MHAELDVMRRDLGGHLRIGASSGPGEHWLPPLLCEFGSAHAGLAIELHVTDARSIVEMVGAGELEIGFVGGRWSRAGLRFDPVHNDDFVLIAAPTHRLAKKRNLLLDELAGADFVLHEPGTGLRATLEQELSERGLTFQHFNVLAELGNQESVKSAVIDGWGISCVWRGAVESELELGRLSILDVSDFTPDNNFYAVRPASRQLSRRAQTLMDFVIEALEEPI
jgi:DNA-binding transcriptional LysR family regulator